MALKHTVNYWVFKVDVSTELYRLPVSLDEQMINTRLHKYTNNDPVDRRILL